MSARSLINTGFSFIFFFLLLSYLDAQESKLVASDGAAYDYFGTSLALDGDYAIIGASWDDDMGSNCGSAYIFHHTGANNWMEESKVVPSTLQAESHFGNSVDISGNYAIIGANGDNANRGAAYIYYRSWIGWVQQAKLIAFDGAVNDNFGFSVAIDGNYAVVGAKDDDDMGSCSGSIYVFTKSGNSWVFHSKLHGADCSAFDNFGTSVDISGNYIIAGADADDDMGQYSGSAHIFYLVEGSWLLHSKLTASDGEPQNYFGYSVALDGTRALVGAYGNGPGAAYVFEKSSKSWIEKAKLSDPDFNDNNELGCSVALSGDFALLGACKDGTNGNSSGAAYLFKNEDNNWNLLKKITPSDPAAADRFGCAVSLHSDFALIGSNGDDDLGLTSGSAYSFDLDLLLGVPVKNNENAITLFPNPANNKIFLDSDLAGLEKAWIFNQEGKCLKKIQISGKEINIDPLARGSYYLLIRAGNQMISKKFIVQ